MSKQSPLPQAPTAGPTAEPLPSSSETQPLPEAETGRPMQLAAEFTIVNKIADDDHDQWERTASGFGNVEMTQQELANHINDGHPFCAQHTNQRRKSRNFLCSDVLAVDIDKGMRLDDVMKSAFVQQHAAIVYTTPSHAEREHHIRVIFQPARTITDAAEMEAAYTGLARKFGGDHKCTDACRFFFGSKGSNPIVLGNIMSNEALDELLVMGREERLADTTRDADGNAVQRGPAARRSGVRLDPDQQVKLKNGMIMPVAELDHGTIIHCPKHEDDRPSAYIVRSQQGIAGVHCRTCRATFWPPSQYPSRVDFYQVEDIVREAEYGEDQQALLPAAAAPVTGLPTAVGALLLELLKPTDADEQAIEAFDSMRSHFTFSTPFLGHLDAALFEGVTFVRSPKGSGKTQWLERVVEWCKEHDKKVLLFGHRQTLLDSMAARLGLTCYYYMDAKGQRNNRPDSYYAICLDSVGKLLNTKFDAYDVVIIDESEQVISHLTGGTMRGKRRECALKLFYYLRKAKSVIVSDADLGAITVEAISQTVGRDTPYRFYINEYKESRCPFYFYGDEAQLVEQMVQAIREGGRHYVTTNSKTKAEALAELVYREFGEERKALLVTSETVKQPEVQQFINHVKSEFLDYAVVIASPTMGTGIDITFPENAQLVDNVYGFFETRVNTHFDIDQQLARVRHPKAIRVWVAGQTFGFETDPNVIRQEAEDNGTLSDALLGIRPDGSLVVDEPYLRIYARVVSDARASKNRLRHNLHELRVRNGWQVESVASDTAESKEGEKKLEQAKAAVKAKYNAALCAADKIDQDQYRTLRERSAAGGMLTKQEELSMRRREVELFYRTDITLELAELDDRGAYRDKVRLMEVYLTPLEYLKTRAMAEHDAEYLPTDRSHEMLKKVLLHELLVAAGIADDDTPIKPDVYVTKESLGQFVEVCQRNRSKIQELFGLYVRKDVSRTAVRQLRDILELMGVGLGGIDRKKQGGVTTNVYPFDAGSWEVMKEIVERRVSTVAKSSTAWFDIETDSQRAKKKRLEKEAKDRAQRRGLLVYE